MNIMTARQHENTKTGGQETNNVLSLVYSTYMYRHCPAGLERSWLQVTVGSQPQL